MIKINIPRRSNACSVCQNKFEPGSEYCSLLDEGQRSDFCIECWKLHEKKGSCFWRATISKKSQKPSDNRNEKAFTLFRESEDHQDAERWILALFLSRQKIFFLKQEFEKEGRKYQVYETTDGEAFAVAVISISASQIQEIQQKLAHGLQ